MNVRRLTPRQALNKAFLTLKPDRTEFERFTAQCLRLLEHSNATESEEFHKHLLADFFKNTAFSPQYFINTKGRNDLVIHNGRDAASAVGVIIEVKKPTNKAEMLTHDRLNVKALHELVLYYLRERISHQNLEIRHIIAVNVYEWFIFDAAVFERAFAQNGRLVQYFKDFEAGRLAGSATDFFYKEIVEPAINSLTTEVTYTWFDLRDCEKSLRNARKNADAKLIALFKLLSPEHLLKRPFANDSNRLNAAFYSELLHIIGLAETKHKQKKLIERKAPGERQSGSLLENAMIQLDSLDKLARLEQPEQFGETPQERLLNVGLELAITWINRILFLKLLEAQLRAYHKGDPAYSFLNRARIRTYGELNSLFFQVLARRPAERHADVNQAFAQVPYLNSSLFEPTELEHAALFISNLSDEKTLPLFPATVLKDARGKRRSGEMHTLAYLFEFLDAYDFASEGAEAVQDEPKSLINASVLGLIFEKINGYKDGSFFTPGFITMYMCRETLRRAVVQKFNARKGWHCQNLEELYDKIEDRQEANEVINSLKICDPAVGSGHFLVSALNELIAIKSELKILQDRKGRRLKEYQVEVVNDELVATDEDGELFEYHPHNPESQRVQETLFHEKQTLIENCLFGVDINPNSVKICRLRLWIELLKNAYYRPSSFPSREGSGAGLETLPNIDINIKCGHSLISRFALDADMKQALRKQKWTIETYRNAVQTYRNAANKAEKRDMEQLIAAIKSDFRAEIGRSDPKVKRLHKLRGELYTLLNQQRLFAESAQEQRARKKQQETLEKEIAKLNAEIEDIQHNKIYTNAFEWRFEFPEVLNADGDFVGFDVVIGNPPYVNFRDIKSIDEKKWLLEKFSTSEYQSDLFILFIEQAYNILHSTGNFGFIVPNSLTNNLNNSKIRKFILDQSSLQSIVNTPIGVFPDATVDTIILLSSLPKKGDSRIFCLKTKEQEFTTLSHIQQREFENNENFYFNFLTSPVNRSIIQRIENGTVLLGEICNSSSGIKEYEEGKGKPAQTENDRMNKVFNSHTKINELYRQHITGSDVCNFFINWKGGYLKYGEWLAAPRDAKFFEGKRVIIREIPSRNRLVAAYTDENFTVKNTAHVFIPNSQFDAKFLVGILNSSLIGFYFVNKFSERDNVFPKSKIGQCRLLPIKNVSPEQQKPISAIVDHILAAKQQDPHADTSALEREIDRLVYALYGLSAEEIAIVEQAEA